MMKRRRRMTRTHLRGTAKGSKAMQAIKRPQAPIKRARAPRTRLPLRKINSIQV
jgi:hypothetical protein